MSTIFDPPENQAEVHGYLTPERTGADGKPRQRYWMPVMTPRQRRDTSRKALEHNAKKQADQRANRGKKYKSAREIAEALDEGGEE